MQSDCTADHGRRFGYVLQNGAEPKRDSIEFPGPPLLFTRGELTSIEVMNRTNEPTTVHWHGIEVESYFDGVPGRTFVNGSFTPSPKELEVGTTYRIRIADIRFSEVPWACGSCGIPHYSRGARLPRMDSLCPHRRLRCGVANVPSGETADFEFTPERPGELQLEIGASPVNVTTIVKLRVSAKRESRRADGNAR